VTISADMLIFGGIGAVFVVFLALFGLYLLRQNKALHEKMEQNRKASEESMLHVMKSSHAVEGGLQHLQKAQIDSQSAFTRALEERLDKVSHRMGQSLEGNNKTTMDSLAELRERLAVIDKAQKNIFNLSEQMVGLQDILSNKQARGAFGEIQMNDLISSILPPSAYEFQATLSNGKRADCLIKLPNPPGSIVVDSKFPLESFQRMRNAQNDEERKLAGKAFGADILKHVKVISEKYILQGETAESALMFLPSEAVYAELHANFTGVIEKSYKARVWIVSPTTLMATLNTVRAVLKDASMREQAGVIQKEVGKLAEDIMRLDSRVDNLRKHFNQADKDITEITTSSRKITSGMGRIEKLQLEETSEISELTLNNSGAEENILSKPQPELFGK
jgi:DNA recombination protein RmuC